MLLESNAKLLTTDCRGHTPLDKACRKGCKEVAELLIQHGAAVNARDSTGWNPLHLASYGGYDDLVRLLLAKNADFKIVTNDTRQTMLVLAIDGLSNEKMKDETRKKGYMDTIMLLGCLVDPIERKNALRNCADLGDLNSCCMNQYCRRLRSEKSNSSGSH
jgi:ankyrin repeat protein